jgi:WD40 repeat protein
LLNGDIVSGFRDQTVKVWDIENGLVKKSLNFKKSVNTLITHSSGNLFIGIGDLNGGEIHKWNTSENFSVLIITHPIVVINIQLYSNEFMVSLDHYGNIYKWAMNGTIHLKFKFNFRQTSLLLVLSNQDILSVSEFDHFLTVWNGINGTKMKTFDEWPGVSEGILLQNDTLFTSNYNGILTLWNSFS